MNIKININELFKGLKFMTSLLYYSYSSGLSEADKLVIDKSVFENRLALRKFVKKVHGKSKVIVISTTLVILVFFSGIQNVDAIGLSRLPQASIVRLDTPNSYTSVGRSGISIHGLKQDKVLFLRNRELLPFVSIMDERFIRNNEISKLIKGLRGGSWTTALIRNAVFLAVLYTIWVLSGGTKGFVTPRVGDSQIIFMILRAWFVLRIAELNFMQVLQLNL